MIKRLVVFAVCILGLACSVHHNSKKAQVKTYYDGFIKGDYSLVKQVLADDFTTVEGDYTTAYTPTTYYELFKWDSVFKPDYQIKKIEEAGNEVTATVAVSNHKFEFLKNNPLVFKKRFSFKNGKISKSVNIEFIGTDWDAWEAQKQALINWIAKKHPELDGFMYDLTLKGALNYERAIHLYLNRSQKDSI